MPWGPGDGRTRTGSGRSGARGASPGVAAGALARRDRDSVGGSGGRGARPCLSPNRMAAATGGALRGPRLRPPHPPAGGASFAVGQDVVARGGSCKGERCHGLGTVLPVASPAHGDEPPRPPGSQHHYLSPRGAWCLREWPPCLRRASSNRMPQRGPHASCRCPRTGFQGPQGHPGGPQPLPERASGCPPPPTAHMSLQRSGLATDR